MGLRNWVAEKLNPAQPAIARKEGESIPSTSNEIRSLQQAYIKIEAVNRGVNLVVDAAVGVDMDIGKTMKGLGIVASKPRQSKLERLLNFQPNPYITTAAFRSNIYIDLLLEGNAFIYYDGTDLYNLPAEDVEIITDKKTFIKEYIYNTDIPFKQIEIIHLRENSAKSIYRGTARLLSSLDTINTLNNMTQYQKNFFKNSTVTNLVITTPNILGKRIKDRILEEWARLYNPHSGGRRPIILDGEFKLDTIGNGNFQELDFANSTVALEQKVYKALGVPPVLIESGNNANISPNNRLFYTNTIMPLTNKLIQGMERFFGVDLKANTHDILALKPELRDTANYLSSLTNAGIMTREEAREKIRLPKSNDPAASDLIVPANVAGSAANAGVGGKPPNGEPE